MTTEQIITIVINGLINLTILFFIIRSNTVVKERLRSQDDINQKMKSFMDIFSVDLLKKYVEVRNETMKLNLENHIEKHRKEFNKDSEQIIRKILDKELAKEVEDIESKYDEICEGIYALLLIIPIEDRPLFIEEYLKLTGDAFITELKNYNEWPNI
jgi:hypothetical protein